MDWRQDNGNYRLENDSMKIVSRNAQTIIFRLKQGTTKLTAHLHRMDLTEHQSEPKSTFRKIALILLDDERRLAGWGDTSRQVVWSR